MSYIILICLSLFSPIEENIALETKYLNLFDLFESMVAVRINKRSNCEQILNDRNLWALNSSELMKEMGREIILNEIKTIEENFHLYFIKTKFKLHKNFS